MSYFLQPPPSYDSINSSSRYTIGFNVSTNSHSGFESRDDFLARNLFPTELSSPVPPALSLEDSAIAYLEGTTDEVPNFLSNISTSNKTDIKYDFDSMDSQLFPLQSASDYVPPSISESSILDTELPIINEVGEEESGAGMALGIAGSFLAGGLAQHQAEMDLNKNLSGQGVAGFSFGSAFQSRVETAHDNLVGTENSAMIGLGSLAGPYGVAAGMLAGGLNSVFNQPEEATVQNNTGEQIPVSALNS